MNSTLYTSIQRENAPVARGGSGQLGISLHAWAPYKMVNIDVFSCEEYSVEDVVAFACETFQTRDVEIHTICRATRSPRISAREQQYGRTTEALAHVAEEVRAVRLPAL